MKVKRIRATKAQVLAERTAKEQALTQQQDAERRLDILVAECDALENECKLLRVQLENAKERAERAELINSALASMGAALAKERIGK